MRHVDMCRALERETKCLDEEGMRHEERHCLVGVAVKADQASCWMCLTLPKNSETMACHALFRRVRIRGSGVVIVGAEAKEGASTAGATHVFSSGGMW